MIIRKEATQCRRLVQRVAYRAVVSARALHTMDMPPVKLIWGDLLRWNGRLAIIGKPKTAKSFFAMQLGFHIAGGTPFLGMDTEQSRVLYVNFEISQEKLQERLQDQCLVLGVQPPENLAFTSIGAMALEQEAGKLALEEEIKAAKEALGGLDVLILDPRRQAMGGDENQSEVLGKWCTNVDDLRTEHRSGSGNLNRGISGIAA